MLVVNKDNIARTLDLLREAGVDNSWAIQDLQLWPENTQMAYVEGSDGLSYVLKSGHPASHGSTTLVMRGLRKL